MSSRKKSTKTRRSASARVGSSSRNGNVATKPEFVAHSVPPEEAHEYWGTSETPVTGTWVQPGYVPDPAKDSLSKCTLASLAVLRTTCRVPQAVEFRLPGVGETAATPPDGYFTCYEAFLLQAHMWFPIPEIVSRFLHKLGFTIGQVFIRGVMHVVGILVLSYEKGLILKPEHLGHWLHPWMKSDLIQIRPKFKELSIVTGFPSNFHDWKDWFFYVRADEASVEPEGLPFFRTSWGTRVFDPLPQIPEDQRELRELLLSGDCFWGNFTPSRVRLAIKLHRSRFHPDLPVENDSDSSYDRFVPRVPRRRRGSSSRKDKSILIEDDGADTDGCLDNIVRDYFAQEMGRGDDQTDAGFDPPLAEDGPSEVPEFDKASRMVNGGLLIMNKALSAGNLEARRARLRAELAEKEVARLKEELESTRRGPIETEIRRARRRGRREVTEVVMNRRDAMLGDLDELTKIQEDHRNFRECRGVMGGLFLTKGDNYSFDAAFSKQAQFVSERTRDFSTAHIEQRIRAQWELDPVSADTVEVDAAVPDDDGEVNQPDFSLRTEDFGVRVSTSGNVYFD